MGATMLTQCRSCGANIRWVISDSTGKVIPIDADASAKGNLRMLKTLSQNGQAVVVVVSGAEREALRARGEAFMSHFATCPQGPQWRRPRPSDGRPNGVSPAKPTHAPTGPPPIPPPPGGGN